MESDHDDDAEQTKVQKEQQLFTEHDLIFEYGEDDDTDTEPLPPTVNPDKSIDSVIDDVVDNMEPEAPVVVAKPKAKRGRKPAAGGRKRKASPRKKKTPVAPVEPAIDTVAQTIEEVISFSLGMSYHDDASEEPMNLSGQSDMSHTDDIHKPIDLSVDISPGIKPTPPEMKPIIPEVIKEVVPPEIKTTIPAETKALKATVPPLKLKLLLSAKGCPEFSDNTEQKDSASEPSSTNSSPELQVPPKVQPDRTSIEKSSSPVIEQSSFPVIERSNSPVIERSPSVISAIFPPLPPMNNDDIPDQPWQPDLPMDDSPVVSSVCIKPPLPLEVPEDEDDEPVIQSFRITEKNAPKVSATPPPKRTPARKSPRKRMRESPVPKKLTIQVDEDEDMEDGELEDGEVDDEDDSRKMKSPAKSPMKSPLRITSPKVVENKDVVSPNILPDEEMPIVIDDSVPVTKDAKPAGKSKRDKRKKKKVPTATMR